MSKRFVLAICAVAASLSVSSCIFKPQHPEEKHYRRVFIVYNGGYNNLAGYLREDIDDLTSGEIPEKDGQDALFVFSHTADKGYSDPTAPVLIKLYRDPSSGEAVRDTVFRYDRLICDISTDCLREVLDWIRRNYPADSYGMLISSHGSGWIPAGRTADGPIAAAPQSVGIYVDNPSNPNEGIEFDIKDLAAALPMHFEWFIFDACYMGCVEVAYEMKDKCDKLIMSPAEILTAGFEYRNMAGHVFAPGKPDLTAICKDLMQQNNYATVSLVDCSKLDMLAGTVSSLAVKYRNELKKLDSSRVQRYYRQSAYRYLWDLKDIFYQAGADAQDIQELQDALDGTLLFTRSSKQMFELRLARCCGYSMYIPGTGDQRIESYYKALAWNEAVHLVE